MARGKFIFGAVLGALFALAFAPKKGSELRKDIKSEIDKGGHGEDTLKKTAKIIGDDFIETGKIIYHDPEVQKHIKRGKKEAQKLAEETKAKLQNSGKQWAKTAQKEAQKHKKAIEKEGSKAVDTIKKRAIKTAKSVKKASKPSQKGPKK
jgi:gas vesicle protein